MKLNRLFITCISICFLSVTSCEKAIVKDTLVHNLEEYNDAVANAKPGDEIVLSNGIWKDVEFIFKGEGTENEPIILRAETPGKVFIEGASNLRLGGAYLEVRDLFFRNGHTSKSTVIDFRIDKNLAANHSKVSNCVIEEYTQPDKEVSDHWVELWGRNNELSNCYIAGKSNFGPTVRVFLSGNEHIKNHHQIVNNYFGPRPRKGGPHGETIQIGDSYTSMTPAYVNVSNNYFDRCNGEVEVISNKSNFNEYRNNVFYECEGSLVLRHGNYCVIDGNVFIGNDNSEFIGGIRVINTGHWITNNYFYKIKGNEFRSALAVMNGVPKSPLNRYNQVTDVVVAYNSYIDCKSPWQFSVGSNVSKSDVLPASEIRSARPIRTVLANNLIYNSETQEYPIKNYDKVDGVTFENNITNNVNKSEVQTDGLITSTIEVDKLSNWLYAPVKNDTAVYNGFDFGTIKTDLFGSERASEKNIGAIVLPVNKNKITIDKKLYGTTWFSNEKEAGVSKVVKVSNTKELVEAITNAEDNDVVILNAGVYTVENSIVINKHMTIKSADEKNKAEILYTGAANTPAFEMNPKGNLILEAVLLKGNKEQNAFATLDKDMSIAYNLWIKNAEISNFKNVLKVSKGSFADTISVANTVIKDCAKGIQLAEEKEDKGDYNAEFVFITNSQFENVDESVLDYYRGGYDESTIGGSLVLQNNKFTNCGKKEKTGLLLKNRGIVNVDFSKNTFTNNPVKLTAILWGEKGQKPVDNIIVKSGKIEVQQNLKQKLMY